MSPSRLPNLRGISSSSGRISKSKGSTSPPSSSLSSSFLPPPSSCSFSAAADFDVNKLLSLEDDDENAHFLLLPPSSPSSSSSSSAKGRRIDVKQEPAEFFSPPTSPSAISLAKGSSGSSPPTFFTPPRTPESSSPRFEQIEDGSIELDDFAPANVARFAAPIGQSQENEKEEAKKEEKEHEEKINLQAVRFLVGNYGEIATSLDKHGSSFVHYAAQNGFLSVLDFFRQCGLASCLHLLDSRGNNSLQIAVAFDRPEIVSFLIDAGVNGTHRNNDGHSALRIACDHKNEHALALLCAKIPGSLNERDEQGKTLLHYACAAGHRETVAILIRAGAAPSLKDFTGNNALHASVMLESPEEVLELLIEDRSILEATDRLYRTPLHWASAVGNLAAARFLVKSGAKLEQRDRKGRTPYLLACLSGHSEVAHFLVLKKAVKDVEDFEGRTFKLA